MKMDKVFVGQEVIYVDKQGKIEKGVVVDKNDTYVFVRYEGETRSKSTRPDDLTPSGSFVCCWCGTIINLDYGMDKHGGRYHKDCFDLMKGGRSYE